MSTEGKENRSIQNVVLGSEKLNHAELAEPAATNRSRKWHNRPNYSSTTRKVSKANKNKSNPSPTSTPKVNVNFRKFLIPSLVDSGSARSLISAEIYELLRESKLRKFIKKEDNTIRLRCLTATEEPIDINTEIELKVRIDGFSWVFPFLVSSQISQKLILGADFIKFAKMIIDLDSEHIYFKFNPTLKIPVTRQPNAGIQIVDDSPEECTPNPDPLVQGPDLSHLSPHEKQEVQKFLDTFPNVITTKLGCCKLIEYDIELTDEIPVRTPPYKLTPPKMEVMRECIQKLLDDDVIEPSTSPYCSPCFLVPKPGGQSRLVVDFRKVNQKVKYEAIPIPDLATAFSWFRGAKYYATIDLNSAYNQLCLSKRCRKYTAFAPPYNLYQYKRIPFGLSVGGCVLCRCLDSIFHDLKFKCLVNFIDDIVVFSDTFEGLMENLYEVFRRLEKAGFTVNPAKLKIAVQEIKYLGHRISYNSVRIDENRIKPIRDFEPPTTPKGIARFIGMVGFHARFIENFAELAAPLNKLRRKNVPYEWGDDQQISFEKLKEAIISPPVLQIPDFSKRFVLQCDASCNAIGSCLLQEFEGTRLPIAYASRSLTSCEKKYSIFELECLSAVTFMEHFREFLEHTKFLLETDNQALAWLLGHPRQLGRIGRWVIRIMSFNFEVAHIRGTENVIADCLSRMYEEKEEPVILHISEPTIMNFPFLTESLREHQNKDPNLHQIILQLERKKEVPNYLLRKEILCRSFRNGKEKIVVPTPLKPLLLKYFHESLAGAHLGISKTYNRINENFYWECMRGDVRDYVTKCLPCARSKPARDTHFGPLSSEVASRPMERLFCDYVGPMVRSRSQNTQLLVCIDAFSKYVFLAPTRQANSNTTIKELKRIIQNFGIPETLVTDNTAYFTSHELENWCFSLGIKHVTTSPYYPQPSHAERFNRNLKSALIAYHSNNHNCWDEQLHWLQAAFNSARHESHKLRPIDLMLTYTPRNTLSILWDINQLLPDNPTAAVLRETWHRAKRNLMYSHEKRKLRYEQRNRPNPYKVGDLVLVKAHNISKKVDKKMAKLMERFDGPYAIQRFVTPVTVILGDTQEGSFVKRAHISQLKFYSRKGHREVAVQTDPMD